MHTFFHLVGDYEEESNEEIVTRGTGEGKWTVRSAIDPRWNRSGLGFSGALLEEMKDWISECRMRYGKEPEDYEYDISFEGGQEEEDEQELRMLKTGEGVWSVSSETDPRWNYSGRGVGFILGKASEPLVAWVNTCRKLYGEPPDDCTSTFTKD